MRTKQARAEEMFMRRALLLAARGRGWTNPNPMVGAVLVKNGRVIGTGYHRRVGLPHAEVEALRNVKGSARGATLYTTLEPCAHHGRTPPCADAVIKAGISRVVCATRDPNKIARGGIKKLRRAGIEVFVGVVERAARDLNEAFFSFHEKGRPFVALKFAASLDGKLATRTGGSKWITSARARAYARALRGEYQAVLVGAHTVLKDDPHLGVRQRGKRDPLRIVLDSTLRIPPSAKVLRDANVIVATTRQAPLSKRREFERRGIRTLIYHSKSVPVRSLLADLRKMNIISVLVEGGGTVLGSFLDAGVADKVYAFYAPLLIGGKGAVSIGGNGVRTIEEAMHLGRISLREFDDTVLLKARAIH